MLHSEDSNYDDRSMIQRLLICTDFTDGLQRLVNFVPSLAAGGMRHIVFLHVVPLRSDRVPHADIEKIQHAQERLAPALKQVPVGIEVKVEVQSGREIDTILKTAKTYRSDLILIGAPNRSFLTETLFGSTAIELAQRATIPLMTVRPQMMGAYTSEELNLRCRHLLRYVLIPFDNSEAAQYVVQQIEHFAKTQPDSELRGVELCWVVEEGGRFERSPQEAQQFVRQNIEPVQQRLQATKLATEINVRRGNLIVQVLEAAVDGDISAIALSSKLNRSIASAPSFAGELLRRSWHPVLFFPPAKS